MKQIPKEWKQDRMNESKTERIRPDRKKIKVGLKEWKQHQKNESKTEKMKARPKE